MSNKLNDAPKMKAVAYTRVSTDDQVKGTSLDSQKEACLKHAETLGTELLLKNIFQEEGVSAKLIDRPELAKLLDYCAKHKGEITHCIVWKVDRLARKSEYHHIIKAQLAKYGVKLVSVTEPIGDDPMGNLMDGMLAAWAQFDNEIRLVRTTGGMKKRTQQGGWPHDAQYGYKKTRTATGISSIEPNEDAPLQTKFLEEFATGAYTVEQARYLAYDMGIRDKKGNMFRWQTIENRLKNPIYAGFVRSKYTDGQMIRGAHKALISEKTHFKICAILAGDIKNYSKQAETDWPLRGGFLQHTCGRAMTGGVTTGRPLSGSRYSCMGCRARILLKPVSKRRELVHSEFLEVMRNVRPTEGTQRLFRELVLRIWNDEFKDALSVAGKIDNELAELKSKKSRIIDLFIDGKLTENEKRDKIQQVEQEIAKQSLQRIDADKYVSEKEQIIDGALLFMSDPSSFWNLANLALKKRIQDLIFPVGLVYDCADGFRTPTLGKSYQLITELTENNGEISTLVAATGIEPVTSSL